MHISVLKESGNETRVAVSPHAVKQFIKAGFSVAIEKNAGELAGFSDTDYTQAGAEMMNNVASMLTDTQALLCVNEPLLSVVKKLPGGSFIIGSIPFEPESNLIQYCLNQQITVLSMNRIPRTSRAQSMDSLSSQANLAGYKAILEACNHYHRIFPMMMTAAGMIQPAKVLILGAGVAGLQAIATAKRLGAVIYVFDVRKAAKEQVESLGAEFIEVSDEDAATASGYASETSEAYKKLQAELIDKYAKMVDIIVTTALIPDRKAPLLILKKTVESMKAGSVIVDLATAKGGNCELSVKDKTIVHQGVTIIGNSNLAGLVPTTASELYANNLVNFMQLLTTKPGEITFNPDDDILMQTVLCHAGKYLPFEPKKENAK